MIDVETLRTVQTVPAATILPTQHGQSGRRALALLDRLGELGRPVELLHGRVIGEGGMGIVREAEQVALGRIVAIKTLKPERSDPAAAQDLLREAWITGSLEHPNVVPVHHLEIAQRRGTPSMNRSVFAAGGFMFLAQTVVVVGTTIMGISVATTQVFLLALWAASVVCSR